MRNLFFAAALATASLFGPSVQAEPIEAGKQYVELKNPVPVAQPGKIEVVELFWYGCPHCYEFEPTLNPWIAKLPEDVHFVRVPAMFGGPWDVHGQTYITLDLMRVEQTVHSALFEALHERKQPLNTPEQIADFLAPLGVNKDAFLKTFDSFAVKGQVEKARSLAKAYQITGVPTMVVNGKYRFDLGSAGGPEGALDVANQLIEKERAAR